MPTTHAHCRSKNTSPGPLRPPSCLPPFLQLARGAMHVTATPSPLVAPPRGFPPGLCFRGHQSVTLRTWTRPRRTPLHRSAAITAVQESAAPSLVVPSNEELGLDKTESELYAEFDALLDANTLSFKSGEKVGSRTHRGPCLGVGRACAWNTPPRVCSGICMGCAGLRTGLAPPAPPDVLLVSTSIPPDYSSRLRHWSLVSRAGEGPHHSG